MLGYASFVFNIHGIEKVICVYIIKMEHGSWAQVMRNTQWNKWADVTTADKRTIMGDVAVEDQRVYLAEDESLLKIEEQKRMTVPRHA